NLPASRLRAEYGFTPGKDWVDHVMRASARIAGGCSASFVSRDGLVMTNHHCAAACVSQLSSAKKNFIAEGFLARNREEEVRCPEIEVNRLERISDVTGQVKGAVAGLDGEAFKLAKNAVEAKLSSACVGAERETARCDVVDLYHGGRYHLYRYRRFQDVRLVWVPEQAIAFFGGDPDNFNFPRYDLDIALLRVYENDKPARPKDFFPFSKAGAESGEMVFVSGHPGSTQRQLTMSELETFRDVRLIGGLLRLAEERAKPDADRLPEFTDSRLPEVEQRLFSTAPIYPEYETVRLGWSLTKMRELLGADDPFVRLVLGRKSPDQVAAEWVAGTK